MESRFGHDFGRVRVHTGPEADRSAAELGAHAYTLGLDVHFRNGRYRPDQPAGQALLVHELEHVARAGPAGPAVPRLAPDPAADNETQIRAILTARKPKPQALLRFLDAHPDALPLAEKLLSEGVAGSTTVKMLRALIAKFPDSEARVAELVRKNTEPLRQDARTKTREMWQQYRTAAFAYAVVQWTTKQRDAEKKKRPKPPRGSRTRPEPSALEQQYEAWRVKAQARFDELADARPAALSSSNAAITAMLSAAQPVPYSQADVLEELGGEIQDTLSDARVVRLDTFDDVQLLGLQESPAVARQLAKDRAALDAKKEAEAKATQARQRLDPAEPGSGMFAPLTRAQTKALGRAKRAEDRAKAATRKAEAALTWKGTRNKDVRAFLRSQDPAERAAAEGRLAGERTVRDAELAGFLPDGVDFLAFDRDALLPDDQRWWIYHTALLNVSSGFPGFSQERSVAELVSSRSIVAKNRTALGVDHSVSLGTYHGHGEGQYDVHAPSGKDVLAVQPDVVDLRRAFRSKTPLFFKLQGTQVRSATEIGPEHGDQDVLAKLVYGFFGRGWKEAEKIDAFLAGTSTGKRSPDASRVVAALVFEDALPDSPVSAGVDADRQALRDKLEAALRAEFAAQTPKVDIPATTKILATVDASSGSFGGISMITPEVVEVFKAVAPVRGRTKPYGTKGKVKDAVFKAVRKILLADNDVTKGAEDLIRKLWQSNSGTRSGPAVTLIHHYKEVGGDREAWVEVDYRHLSAVEPLTRNADVTSGTVIGKVGSSGNAVSPHIHQAIRVYVQDPRQVPEARVKDYLVPLDFFPFVLPGRNRPTAGAPSTDEPL